MKAMNNERLEDVYNGLCGVRNVLDWAPEISMEKRREAAEKSFREAEKDLFQADEDLVSKATLLTELAEALCRADYLSELVEARYHKNKNRVLVALKSLLKGGKE